MKVAVERVTKAGRGARERSHLPDEGEDDREGVGGRGNEGEFRVCYSGSDERCACEAREG